MGRELSLRRRFAGFATTMHALGTVAAGAAIALVGQIFNMQEHWPAAVMLWALCALAGWWLLGDQFQQTLSLLLVPAWLISEWMYRASVYRGSEVYLERMIAVLAAVYLTGFLHSRKRVVFGILFGVSAVVLCICVRILADGWQYYSYGRHDWGFLPLHLRLVAFVILILTLGFGWYLSRQSVVPAGVVAVMAFVLPWAQTVVVAEGWNGQPWKHSEANLFAYVVVAATAVLSGVVGCARREQGVDQLWHCGVCADGDVVLFLEHYGQAGTFAGVDYAGCSVSGGRLVAGEDAEEAGGKHSGGGGMTQRSRGVGVAGGAAGAGAEHCGEVCV